MPRNPTLFNADNYHENAYRDYSSSAALDLPAEKKNTQRERACYAFPMSPMFGPATHMITSFMLDHKTEFTHVMHKK